MDSPPLGVKRVIEASLLNVAITDVPAFIVSVQDVPVHDPAPDVLQAPPLVQPVKLDPASGDAVRVTVVPVAYVSEQSAPQSIPAGELVTVPAPVPAFVSESRYTPVPFNGALNSGDAGSFELILRSAAFKPPDAGVNVTRTVQLPLGGMVGEKLGQGSAPPSDTWNIAAFVPAVPIELIARSPYPLLLMVNSWGVEPADTTMFPKSAFVGETARRVFPGVATERTGHTVQPNEVGIRSAEPVEIDKLQAEPPVLTVDHPPLVVQDPVEVSEEDRAAEPDQ